MRFIYPPVRRCDVVDGYHGTAVADPYRWLEDPHSEETRAFVEAQNALSLPYLASLPERGPLLARMTRLWDVPRVGTPTERSGTRVWSHNDGLQNQPVFFVHRPGDTEPSVLLDPNSLSPDGTVAVIATSLSPDGRLFVYSTAESGSDWQVVRIRQVASGADLDDVLRYVKFTTVAWHGEGFFYARFPEQAPDSVEPSRNMSVHYHGIGTHQDADIPIFANPSDPDLGYEPVVSDDGRFLVLIEWVGTSHHNGVLYRSLDEGPPQWIRLVEPGVARHDFLEHIEGSFLMLTDLDAPNGRIVSVPLDHPDQPETVIAETAEPIEAATAAAGRLVVVRMVEASHVIHVYTPDGAEAGGVDLPGTGSITGVTGRFGEPAIFFGYVDFLHPPTALRWHDGVTEVVAGAPPPLDPSSVVVERRSAISTDGADVGMFLVRLADTALPAPVELYGYGGFTISMTPQFDPARLAFLEAGGVVAVANLRGGAERGEDWHREGMLGRKQQVFDDLVACAERLVADGVAAPGSIGIRGRSNGGLLVTATMVQRPELFGAVCAGVPVTDMLRYQHFTAGRYWTVEYGDAADAEAFEWLLAYSPYHNVAEGTDYPPTLITTAEHDDRVVPMHSYKLIAALQRAAGGASDRPFLVRVETRAGHGLGKPTSKVIEERADEYAFLLHHLGPAARPLTPGAADSG